MTPRLRRITYGAAIALPVASLALNLVAWLRYGIALPMYDDWYGYMTGLKGSFSLANLFKPLNDTLAPVGYLFDALAERYLDGNAVAYQFLSMLLVLGGLLWLQWRLLAVALQVRWQRGLCFLLTLLMLQPGSYWGQQNLAYHQALPLVFLLAALLVLLSPRPAAPLRTPLMFVLALLAGLSYVSGAFAALAVGVVLAGVAMLCPVPHLRTEWRRGALALGLGGAFTSAWQFAAAVYPNPGLTHRPDAPLALPYQPDFWWFLLGKLGRSLALPPQWPLASCLAVLGVLALTLVLAMRLLRLALRQPPPALALWRTLVVFACIAAAATVYLFLVAAGRTYLRPPEVKTALQVFAFGFERFHFFWATLLWPWVAAAACVVLRGHLHGGQRLAVSLGVVLTVLMLAGGVLSHAQSHGETAAWRQANLRCLLAQMQRGETVDCPEYVTVDMAAAYAHGRASGAAFVRQFPVLPMPVGDHPPPAFRWTRDGMHAQLHELSWDPGGAVLRSTGSDPQMLLQMGAPEALARCRLLQVSALLRSDQADILQVFYRSLGETDYTEAHSQRVSWQAAPGVLQRLDLQIDSATGFESHLRVDPGSRPQSIELLELEVRCQLAVAKPR